MFLVVLPTMERKNKIRMLWIGCRTETSSLIL